MSLFDDNDIIKNMHLISDQKEHNKHYINDRKVVVGCVQPKEKITFQPQGATGEISGS